MRIGKITALRKLENMYWENIDSIYDVFDRTDNMSKNQNILLEPEFAEINILLDLQ